MIDDFTIRRIKDSANILDVMTDPEFNFDLKRVGKEYQCLCPFHGDRHLGSFSVSATKNIYHCFSCGAHGGPIDFLMDFGKYSFIDAIRWLGKKYSIDVEGAEQFKPKPCKPHPPTPKEDDLPMLVMPIDVTTHTRGAALDSDTLCKWLRQLPWLPEQARRVEMVLKNYGVGHARDGRVIFWNIDENAKVRTGKLMKYKVDGHRDKELHPGWIHNLMAKAGKIDLSKCRKVATLFGMHLLNFFPDANVCLVESEKTALICAIAYGDMKNNCWMAAGGLKFLKPEMLAPIIKAGRHITLFPDRDGIKEWQDFAQALDYQNISINTDFVTKYWQEADGEKADIADVLLRMLAEHGQRKTPLQQMSERNPALKELITTFNLVEKNEKAQT